MDPKSELSKAQRGLRIQAVFLIGFLVIQYILGMVSNLFVQFPETNRPDQLWAFAGSKFPTAAHMIIGTLMLVGAVVFVIRALRSPSRVWIASSVAGLLAILFAFLGGALFTSTQADGYSLLMALSTVAAFVAYGWGLVAARS